MTGGRQHLGEMLRSARESRGLDRARIERDTRIRERYLSALERGAYDELPGDVYARGFLRTYARYLGLDPDAMVAVYRIEIRAPVGERVATGGRRRPMEGPRPRAFALAPGVVGAAVLTVMVGALVAYLAYQLITFARTPELRVLEPAGDVSAHQESSMVIRGVTAPNARVSVSGLAENPSVVADDEGRFSVRVELLPGSNLVTLSALDPRTTRQSPEVTRRIEVIGAGDGGESRRPPSAQQG
ncbi:MAG: helix-turn-helix domain-containing protein [Chloroflexi bacterium]|nr:helix-turn-helix domain-containing protein [Chloroflexota bacterium]